MNEEGCWEHLKAIERKVDDILGLLWGILRVLVELNSD